jgi:hypothetical protein
VQVVQVVQVPCDLHDKISNYFDPFFLYDYLCIAAGCSIAFSFEGEESPVSTEHHAS